MVEVVRVAVRYSWLAAVRKPHIQYSEEQFEMGRSSVPAVKTRLEIAVTHRDAPRHRSGTITPSQPRSSARSHSSSSLRSSAGIFSRKSGQRISRVSLTQPNQLSVNFADLESAPSSLEMARALSKVQKKISKKRGGKPTSLHENSRDAQRLRSANAREEKLSRLLDAANRANQIYGR